MESVFLSRYGELFGLKEFEIVDVCLSQGDRPGKQLLVVRALPRQLIHVCPKCVHGCACIHTRHEREIADLPQGGVQTVLKVQILRMRCERCDTHFTPVLSDLHPSSAVTQRFANELVRLVRICSLKEAAVHLAIAESTAESIYYYEAERLVEQAKAAEAKPIRCLGIDEIAVKKGTKITSAS